MKEFNLVEYTLYFLLTFAGIWLDKNIIYILFIVMVFNLCRKERKINHDFMLGLAIYSIVLPDNYSTEFFFILYFILGYIRKYGLSFKKNKYSFFLFLFLSLSILSTTLNLVPAVKILFSIISFAPLFMFLHMINNISGRVNVTVGKYIDKVFWVEIFATVFNFLLYRITFGDDWSCGSFSRSGGQQAQLFVISAYLFIYYLHGYMRGEKDKRLLQKTILAFIMMLSTNCWTLVLFLLLGFGISYIITLNLKKIVLLFIVLFLVPVIFKIGLSILPNDISYTVNRILMDTSYFEYRVHKAIVYKETFGEIPGDDWKFALLGNGVGNYSSRSALICSGNYTDFYNKYFETHISDYTKRYIYDYLRLAYENGDSDFGSVLSRPYSSFISLMGECGYLGLVLFFLVIIFMLRNKSNTIKYIVLSWLCFCLVENYFEYPKILMMLYACVLSAEQSAIKLMSDNARK